MPVKRRKRWSKAKGVSAVKNPSSDGDEIHPDVKEEPPSGPYIRGGTILVVDTSGKLVDFNKDFCKTSKEGVHKRYCTVIFPGNNGEPEVRQIIATVDPEKGAVSFDMNNILNTICLSATSEPDRPIKEEPSDEIPQTITELEADVAIKEEPEVEDTAPRKRSSRKSSTSDEDVIIMEGSATSEPDRPIKEEPSGEIPQTVNDKAEEGQQHQRRSRRKTTRVVWNKKNVVRRTQPKKKESAKGSAEVKSSRANPGYFEESTVSKVSTSLRLSKAQSQTGNGYSCPFCELILEKKEFLKSHIMKLHMNKREEEEKKPKRRRAHVCEVCGYAGSSPSVLQKHMKCVHEKIKDLRCRQCEKSFAHASHLKRHVVLVHKKLKPHRCKDCDKYFGTATQLKLHFSAVHEKSKRIVCPTCGVKFLFQSCLKRHMDSVHLDNVMYHKCSLCEFKSKYKHNLKAHTNNVHKRIKAFVCPLCDYKSTKKPYLQQHLSRIHKI